MFTIAADRDIIPRELLYPLNGSNDNGFLAEQFPVVRRAYAARRVTALPIGSAALRRACLPRQRAGRGQRHPRAARSPDR